MSNAGKVLIQRLAGTHLPCARWTSPAQSFRGLRQPVCRPFDNIAPRRFSDVKHPLQSHTTTNPLRHAAVRSFSQSVTAHILRPRKDDPQDEQEEKGLAFMDRELSLHELSHIFGRRRPPAAKANQLLRILHGRRNDGTLDLPLSPNMRVLLQQYPSAFDQSLSWLRENYEVDEDTAILERLDREAAAEEYSPSELKQRGQDLGLYHPQSGKYQAELSDSGREGDVWGKSALESIRAENEAKAAEEEEELQKQIDEIMATKQLEQETKNKSLTERPDQSLQTAEEIRAPNEFEKWILRAKNKAGSKIEMDDVEAVSFTQRVLPSAVFVALIGIGCYLYAQYWTPPRRADRLAPNISLTYATVLTIAGLNLLIFTAWRFPPAWSLLTKYFVMTPGYPRALSMVGSTFSHQTWWHLFNNMLGLFILGTSLHEDVGRGTFLAIWLASGVCGSLASLSFHAARRSFVTSSLGASGSVCGTVAALCWLHADKRFSLIFLPDEWKDTFSIRGWMVVVALMLWEGYSLFRPLKKIDHAGHLGGMFVGLLSAQMMEKRVALRRDDDGGAGDGKEGARRPLLHAALYDLKDGVSAYFEGDQKKLSEAKKGRGRDVGLE